MQIPAIAVSIATFPGVIVHELAQQLFCRWFKIPVFQVVYFQVGSPAGFVLHEVPPKKWQSILIIAGPFLINTILGAIIALPAALPVFTLDNANWLHYLLMYLGVSVAMHAFPGTEDATNVLKSLREKGTSPLTRLVGYPIVGLIWLGAAGSKIWLHILYGVAVAVGIPQLIIYRMA